ncbi:MAG TPA: bifunctional precorrin-2 dehydrogenase/sirohydrochlorin ferrochelatase [Nitrospirae bacterium]|nr:siroheme synthase [bacterium BMS3Abin10]HDK80968.1 bifunctional precorrin-2 dehydrogenase/sirohydrochlorin ferrochelatase [Nitrospirota bacterium]
MKYYPVYLNLTDKKAVVIGGGKVAERKVLTLINAGAKVKVISPGITKTLEKVKKKGALTHIKRHYRKGDLKDSFIVIAGTSSAETNTKIARDAKYLVNIIDTPTEGNFIAPSIVKRGPLTIAISTEGCSPAVSKAIRKEIEKLYGREFADYLRLLGKTRVKALKKIKDVKEREQFLKGLASEKLFSSLRKKGAAPLSKKISSRLR